MRGPVDVPLNPKQFAEWFPQYPYLPMLINDDALRETVAKGVRDGVLAPAYGEPPDIEVANVKYKLPNFSSMEVEVTESGRLLRPHLAEKYIAEQKLEQEDGRAGGLQHKPTRLAKVVFVGAT